MVASGSWLWDRPPDFHGHDPKTAMADEAWDRFKSFSRFYPVGFARADGKYVVVPMKGKASSPH